MGRATQKSTQEGGQTLVKPVAGSENPRLDSFRPNRKSSRPAWAPSSPEAAHIRHSRAVIGLIRAADVTHPDVPICAVQPGKARIAPSCEDRTPVSMCLGGRRHSDIADIKLWDSHASVGTGCSATTQSLLQEVRMVHVGDVDPRWVGASGWWDSRV